MSFESESDVLLRAYVESASAGASGSGSEFVEPLLAPDRLQIGGVCAERQAIMALYERSRAVYWTEHELDLSHDQKHWNDLTPDERFFVSRVLAFFAQSDGLVADNCTANFGDEITWREFRLLFGWQAMMEGIHNLTYSLLIDTYLREDEGEKARLFDAIQHIPTIAAKAAWTRKYMDQRLPLAARLVAFVVTEGVFFSGAFCAIFWLKKRGLLPGLSLSNEFISRDEALHAETSVLAYSFIERKLPQAYVHALFAEAVAVEHEFVRDSLPCALIGMNADTMCAYICFVADKWLERLGYAKLFRLANPFEWMELISLNGKTNFFESVNSGYSRALSSASAAAQKTVFSTTADF